MGTRKIKRSRSKRRTRRISRKYSRTKQRTKRGRRRTKRGRRKKGGYPRGQIPAPAPAPEELPEVAPVGPHAVVAPEVGYWEDIAHQEANPDDGVFGRADVQPFGDDLDQRIRQHQRAQALARHVAARDLRNQRNNIVGQGWDRGHRLGV
jgi:hypothetical protein